MKRRTLVVESAGSVLEHLADGLEVPLERAQALVNAGAVYLEGKRVKDGAAVLSPGARLSAVLEEGGREVTAAKVAPPLVVLHEDGEVLVVDKPAGLVAQPTEGGEFSLLDLASQHLGREAGLVHRLDRETSGVTLFGKTKDSTSALAAAFREGRAIKHYVAICGPGLPERGELDLPLSRDSSRPGRWRASTKHNGISALTHYERLFDSPEFCVVSLRPQTGRTHQLRAHLTALDCPILGDRLYGGTGAERCLLHAWSLKIDDAFFVAPLPDDVRAFWERAGLHREERHAEQFAR